MKRATYLKSRKKKYGGGVRNPKLFLETFFPSTAIKLEGGGGLCLNGPAIKRRSFFAASLTSTVQPAEIF